KRFYLLKQAKILITNFFGEFDLGSGRTLAACLILASRAREADNHPSGCASVERAAGGCVSRGQAACEVGRSRGDVREYRMEYIDGCVGSARVRLRTPRDVAEERA